MIKSFKHKGLRELKQTGKSRLVSSDFVAKSLRILDQLEVAVKPEDMNIAGYFFHGMQTRPKRWSVRINKNWRITFAWLNGAVDVDLEDYH